MTRSILCLAGVLGTLTLAPLSALASVDGCAQTLLQSPADELYSTLQVTDGQTTQITIIRNDLNRRNALAQSDAELDRELALGIRRTAAVMTPWQREQCADVDPEPVYAAPAPIIVAPTPVIYRTPVVRGGYRAPVYRTGYRAPVYRTGYRAPAYRTGYRAPAYRAPEHRPAPVYRAPEHRPAPVYRAPEHRPAPVYRAPAATVRTHAPAVDRTPPSPSRAPAPAGGHGGHRR
jgi:hypothetical protein